MKRYFLLSLLAVAGIISCGKDDDDKNTTASPDAITAAAKVHYGTKVDGQLPAVTADAPKLYAGDNETTFIFAGGFVIIDPSVESGDAKGYFAQIEGAKAYFKIDYSQPRGARIAKPGLFKIQEGAADSLIIIKLPESITSGEFCVNIAAYNEAGQIGNIVKHCFTVTAPANETSLKGTWLRTGEYEAEKQKWRSRYDSSANNFYCLDGRLSYECPNDNGCEQLELLSGLKIDSTTMTFGTDASWQFLEARTLVMLNMETSSCSAPLYDKEFVASDPFRLSWSYDKSNKRLILSNNPSGDQELDVETYPLEINGNKFVITVDEGDKMEFTKK